jgi:trans-L-3-hydroxyproline dehydratase
MGFFYPLEKLERWTPPQHWQTITTFDTHTGGEPLRIVMRGFPDLAGETILARRRTLKDHHDHLRSAIMWEPRGHREMYGCVLTPPVSREADFGVLFMHNEGYSSMCGHGIIALATVAVNTGLVLVREPETTVRIDTPAGLVTAHARVTGGRATSVFFQNVPSFVLALDEVQDVPGLGKIRYDLAFGGAFYAYVRAEQLGLRCVPEEIPAIVEKGMAIKHAVMNARPIPHPLEKDLSFLYGTIIVAPPLSSGTDSRNVCVFADGEVDRSPTGTGVSGRMAIHFARKELGLHQQHTVESIVGSRFIGTVREATTFAGIPAVIPEVEGSAYITGKQEFFLDPNDPFKSGFIL